MNITDIENPLKYNRKKFGGSIRTESLEDSDTYNERTPLILAINVVNKDPWLTKFHHIVLLLMDAYLIYAFIVNLNDGPLLAALHCVQIALIFIFSNLSLILKPKFWLKLSHVYLGLFFMSLVNSIIWAILYFIKPNRENIAVDNYGQDFAGYLILSCWNLYLYWIHSRAVKLKSPTDLLNDSENQV